MDIGESMNPAIDIGQIEGAFLQVSSQWQRKHAERIQCLLPNYNYNIINYCQGISINVLNVYNMMLLFIISTTYN